VDTNYPGIRQIGPRPQAGADRQKPLFIQSALTQKGLVHLLTKIRESSSKFPGKGQDRLVLRSVYITKTELIQEFFTVHFGRRLRK